MFADEAAASWGRNGAVFVRSSASHVFRAGDLVLRMAPLGSPQAEAVARSATTAQTLARLGAPVPAPVRSLTGRLVEEIDGMAVTALPVVPGKTYDDDELTREVAWLWGRTLARFHETGWVHGDPEPDNLVVDGDGDEKCALFVDLDDAGPGDEVEDVAFALREWTPPGGAPDLSADIPAAFLAGYRDVRALTDADMERLPAAARTVAFRTLASYDAHLTTAAEPDWPDWALRLQATVAARAERLRSALGSS